MDVKEYRRRAHEMVDMIADYYENLERYPVIAQVEPGYLAPQLPTEAPLHPEPFETIMQDLQEKIMPGVTHWQHPNFFAFFPANSSFPAMLGDMVSNMINCIGFNWVCSPACTELETIVVDWMAHALGLPDKFLSSSNGGGVIQATASDAVIVALVAARARASRITQDRDLFPKLVMYASSQAHSSFQKAARVLGITMRTLPVADDLRLQPEMLRAQVAEDIKAGLHPFFVGATVGTTSTGAVDPVRDLGVACQELGLWLHVDAAYAGSAAVCPEYQYLLDGVELASSFNFNAHKWLLTNFDCSLFWVDDRRDLLTAMNISRPYYKNAPSESGRVLDYRDWQLPLGRRFRALKLWFVFRCYGLSGLQAHIRKHVALAQEFEELVAQDDRFELCPGRFLSLVCFRLRGDNAKNAELVERANKRGIFMISTSANDKTILRLAVGAPATESKHIKDAWLLLQELASEH